MTGGLAVRERVPSTVLRAISARPPIAPRPLPALDPEAVRRALAPTPAEAWADALPYLDVRVTVNRGTGAYSRRCPAATLAAHLTGRTVARKRPDCVLPDGRLALEVSPSYLEPMGVSRDAARAGYRAFLDGSGIEVVDYAALVALGGRPAATGRLAGAYLLVPPALRAACLQAVEGWERRGLLPPPPAPRPDAGTWPILALRTSPAPGRNFPFRCPSGTHADLHPSASGRMDAHGALGTWHCFACGASGILRRAPDGSIAARTGPAPENRSGIPTVQPSVSTNRPYKTEAARAAPPIVDPNPVRRGLFSAPWVNPRTSPRPTVPTRRSLRPFVQTEQSPRIPENPRVRQAVQPTRRPKPIGLPIARERPWRPTARPPVRPMLSSLGAFGHRYRGHARHGLAITLLMDDARTKWPSQIAKAAIVRAKVAEARALSPDGRFDRRAILPDALFCTGATQVTETRQILSKKGRVFRAIRKVETIGKDIVALDLDGLDALTFEEAVLAAPHVAAYLRSIPALAGAEVFGVMTSDRGLQFFAVLPARMTVEETETDEWKATHAEWTAGALEAARAGGLAGGEGDATAATAGQYARRPAWRITKGGEVMPSRLVYCGINDATRAGMTTRQAGALARWEVEIAAVFAAMGGQDGE